NGKGKVILFTSSIDRDWNNFPIQPTFLPWIQRWIKYSARGLDSHLKKNLLIGEPFYLQKSSEKPTVYITSPNGKVTYPSSINGKIEFQDTDTPGVYKIYQDPNNFSTRETSTILPQLPYGAELIGSFNVNIDPVESIPGKISNEEIKSLLPETNITFSSGYQKLNVKKTGESRAISTFILILMGIMLLFEGWLVRKE
ncbi:MAG: BatA domain-containing protein, partial [Nitrospinaceae bacterium]